MRLWLLELLWLLIVRLMLLLRAALLLMRLLAAVRLRLLSRRIGWLLIAEILLPLRRLALHRLILRSLTRVVVVEGIVTVAFTRRRRRLVEGVLLPELLLRRRD